MLLYLLSCFGLDTSGILVVPETGTLPLNSAPSPAQRLANCTMVVFEGLKIDYQCGNVKASLLQFSVTDGTPAPKAAAKLRATMGRETGKVQTVALDGLSVELRGYGGPERTFWSGFAASGSTVRYALCSEVGAVAAADDGQAECAQIVPVLVAYGAVQPEHGGTPPVAGRLLSTLSGCTAQEEPGWHGSLACNDGATLWWSSTPLIKDSSSHLRVLAEQILPAPLGEPTPMDCTIEGAAGSCRQYGGLEDDSGKPLAMLMGYADVRDDGLTVACLYSGAGALPAACSMVMALKR